VWFGREYGFVTQKFLPLYESLDKICDKIASRPGRGLAAYDGCSGWECSLCF